MDDLPSGLSWWLFAAAATQLYRLRARVADLLDAVSRRDRAIEVRDKRIGELLAEIEAERARADALHHELVSLNNALLGGT